MSAVIVLDGRNFVSITQSLPVKQDDYIVGHLRQAGATELRRVVDGVERTREQLAEELLTKILKSGIKQFIVSGCLTEEGKVWDRKEADANAARFAEITSPEEKHAMQGVIVALVIGFFTSGEQSTSETPQKSSGGSEKAPAAKSAARTSGNSRR